jgi:HK97 family phage prohead protease
MLVRHAMEITDMDVTGRTLDMVAVPFDVPAWVICTDPELDRVPVQPGDPYREQFASQSMTHVDARRVQLRFDHSGEVAGILGRGSRLWEDGRYQRAEMTVTASPIGDHALALARDGVFGGVSLGFVPGDAHGDNGVDRDRDGVLVTRRRVKRLPEISLVGEPAYAEAQLVAVRRQDEAARQAGREQVLAFIADVRAALDT